MRWLLIFFLLNIAFVIVLAFMAFMGAGSVALDNGVVTLGVKRVILRRTSFGKVSL